MDTSEQDINSCRVSVVVPVRNGAETIVDCLSAVYSSKTTPHEVIVVDDASTDNTSSLLRQFPCLVLTNNKRLGRGASKNKGLKAARGDLTAFVDADVLVHPDALQSAVLAFIEDASLCAICAVPEAKSPYSNFASRYKALYMHFILKDFPAPTDFLHGCFQVFRTNILHSVNLNFDEQMHCDDIDLGVRLKKTGGKIIVMRQISVAHKKYYSLFRLLRNDFKVSAEFAYLLCKHSLALTSLKQGRFAHARLPQLLGVFAAGATTATLISGPRFALFSAGFAGLFWLLNWPFFKFLIAKENPDMAVRSIVFTLIDQSVMLCGILAGMLTNIARLLMLKRS